ncbi:hypothetical protein [Shewanella algicola]|uniref:hypothetical protein n=1 Tax=Shewanella algicola TaxID=640633 RepID=UPI002494EDAC|nr:hypothetical protein [Shewanella algicola]
MIFLHASYGNEETEQWENIKVIPLKPNKELFPEQNIENEDGFGLISESLCLPNGEVITLGVAFSSSNLSINFVIQKGECTLLNLGAFKVTLEAFDPSVVFRTPNGLDLSFMFSSVNA